MIICRDQVTGHGCGKQNRDDALYCRHCGMPLLRALQILNSGEVVAGRYFIMREIDHGNFGAVYEAQDMQQSNKPVALKQTFDPAHIAQYRAEFAVLSNLQHDNLPCYYDVFEFEGSGYLVMEYVPGQSLQEVLDNQRVQRIEVVILGYAWQLCNTLIYLHGQTPPIIHRDIKPANVRLTPEAHIKLVDFGLVKRLPAGSLARSAAGGSSRMGTPAYASPEQWGINGLEPETRSDIYSLGATLYHLFTGQEPTPANQRVGFDPLLPPGILNPALSRRVCDAVTAALSMNINDRPRDAQELLRRLTTDTVAHPLPSPPLPPPPLPPPPPPQPPPPQRIYPGGCATAVAAIVLSIVLFYAAFALVERLFEVTPILADESATSQGVQEAAPASTEEQAITPTPAPSSPDVWTDPLSGITSVRIPAGEFVMGSTDAQASAAQEHCSGLALGCEGADYACETPQHPVTLGEFWIGLTEVTNAQFRAFVDGSGYADPTWWTVAGWEWRMAQNATQPGCWDDPALNRPDQPVVCVGWHEATAFTRWQSHRTGRAYRLPTEAEWEKAARDGDGRTFPWGDDGMSSLRANFCDAQCAHGRKDVSVDDGFARTAPVGSFPFGASPYGALDMAGNAWEWTATQYRAYPCVPGDGRDSADGSAARTLRGGSYIDTADHARCALRIGVYPDTRNDLIGFRVASSGPPAGTP